MPRFLFWNYRYDGPDREAILARLVRHESVDVLILAEASVEPETLVERLSSDGSSFRPMSVPHPRIQIYAGYEEDVFVARTLDISDRLCVRRFKPPGHQEILLGAVHLASGLRHERSERKDFAAPLSRIIREAQQEDNHARVIIAGDFNMNPFDDGMISTEGFGAMMTRSLVRKAALSSGKRFVRFYNPIWSRLGRELSEGAPGTYYWNKHRGINLYWNYVDQVLVGHDLLDHFPDRGFRILSTIPDEGRTHELIRETERHWKVQVSDHLPILFDVDIPEESDHG